MAVQPESHIKTSSKQAHPRYTVTTVRNELLAQGPADLDLPVLTPLGRNTGTDFYEVLDPAANDGTEIISAFAVDLPPKVLAAGEAPVTIMVGGELHIDDIDLSNVVGGMDKAGLIAHLKAQSPSLRSLGIEVLGQAGLP